MDSVFFFFVNKAMKFFKSRRKKKENESSKNLFATNELTRIRSFAEGEKLPKNDAE